MCDLELESTKFKRNLAKCIECTSIYQHKHYLANKAKVMARSKISKLKKQKYVYDIKKSTPCFDCGNFYKHWVMDFDHRDPSVKEGNISQLTTKVGRARLDAEIAKCDLVCANCHRQRTAKRRGLKRVT